MAKSHPGIVYGRRVAIVGGLRTPFVKAFGKFLKLDSIDSAPRSPMNCY